MYWIWAELRVFRDWSARNPLVTAFSLSFAVHLAFFGGFKLGDRLGWWKHQATWLLNLTKKNQQANASLKPKNFPPQRQEIPLTFVEVDPATATQEAPKNAKNYGAVNSVAAQPDPILDSVVPKVDGEQNKMVRLENVPKPGPQPLQPSLPPEPDKEEARPKPKENPGDTVKKPNDGIAEMNPGEAKKNRPRTLAKAYEKNLLAGKKMRQDGGTPRRGRLALDVVGSPFGSYDAAIIAAIQQRWYDLIDSSQFNQRSGKVVLEFRLNYDGRITDMVMKDNEVGDLLAMLCQRAITDPSPFPKWPEDMRRMVGKNYREVLFTFYYE